MPTISVKYAFSQLEKLQRHAKNQMEPPGFAFLRYRLRITVVMEMTLHYHSIYQLLSIQSAVNILKRMATTE